LGCGAALAAITAINLGCASPASAETPPTVLETPSGEVFARFYPDRAQRLEVQGAATIACVSTEAGLLTACKVTHEWPLGFGFGEAALNLTPFFRMKGAGTFKTTIRFRLEDDGDDPLYMQVAVPDNRVQILSKPTEAQLTAAYPGHGTDPLPVALDCTLTAEGRLENCVPNKSSFGPEVIATAQRMAALYRTKVPPAYLVGQRTTIVLTFIPPDPGEGH